MTDSNFKYRDHGGRPSQEDDPLMELSRIIGFDEPVEDAASQQAADDLSFDLEQELIGGLEAELHSEDRAEAQPETQIGYQPAVAHGWDVPPQAEEAQTFSSDAQPYDGDFDFSASLESELALSINGGDAEDPEEFSLDDTFDPAPQAAHSAGEGEPYALASAPALDPEEYPGDQDAQGNGGYDPTVYEPAYEPVDSEPEPVQAASYIPAPSLEEELEMLLIGGGDDSGPSQDVSPQQDASPQYAAAQAEPAVARYPYYPAQLYSSPASPAGAREVQPAVQAAAYAEPAAPVAEAAPNAWDGEEPQLDEDFFGAEDDGQYAEAEVDDAPEIAVAQPAQAAVYSGHSGYRIESAGPAPEVETVTVSESRVDQTDALDLPEVEYDSEPASNSGLSALENEFAEVFASIEVEDQPVQPEVGASSDSAFDDIFNDSYAAYGAQSQAASPAAYVPGAAAAAIGGYMASQPASGSTPSGTQNDYYNHWANAGQRAEDFAYDPQSADELDIPADADERQPARNRRSLMLASAAGAAVLIGALGYYGLSSGGGDGAPVVIQADSQPIKVQPENPGGNTVPNQDKAVYDRVAGLAPEAPEQKTLVSSEEKPVDIGMAEDDGGSVDDVDTAVNDRIEPSSVEAAISDASVANPTIVPRRVQTMVVRPDGTIVASTPSPAAPATSDVATPQVRPAAETQVAAPADAAGPPAADASEQTGAITAQETLAPSANTQPAANAPARVVNTQTFTPDSVPAKPRNVPVVPSRPAEQPVTIVDSTPKASAQNTQVASAANAATTAAAGAGGYAIQIASQPSPEAAQQSYTNLARRYANIIGGHGVDIRRADIAGKGTYYRVRINAGSKSDAVDLCTRYKAAGGSCFVTQ
ncbi:hypothetical protein ATN84_07400 [Paramesorhizobium deserti]|uniref:SPOR domain-containing protein n=1 Tax=Paramesorhizobium deserti TaxID=1494590 RepID=A0A135HVJ0_9HYPH|nr:SPOR domain-containing protein [Paramesorhizobium deserti]KXF77225.1 hypothetical protein ATN84_07400 [Paramesorhizobium deserti]